VTHDMLERVKLHKARPFVVPLIILSVCATVGTTLNQPHNTVRKVQEATGSDTHYVSGLSTRDPLGITNYGEGEALLRSGQLFIYILLTRS
jgi:hypothetical protein